MSVWFITGASRGFGLQIARDLLDRGHRVVATARHAAAVTDALGDNENVLAVALDVTDEEQARQAVQAAVQRFGRIDVLVNNAGRGLLGAVEEATDAEVRAVYDTNVFGLLTVTRAVAPVLRAQRSGAIVNISSVGGFVSSPGWGVYASTKFAVEALSEALHAELKPLGVHVMVVEPGYFRTDFLDSSSLQIQQNRIDDYADGPAGQMRITAGERNHDQPGDPVKAAAAIIDVVESERPPVRLQLGNDTIAAVEAKLAHVQAELAQWRSVSESTDFDDVA
ncbi:short-chain dehydrogenase/reductase [Mycolicibacter terrae]|uniref:Short-chain dehydrogenase/reductase n=1 Tax=Mycolicibacter terrae TaxID=1788 RepID=A0AAD1I644_9MYCO|nr:oxidoreductase [Mycolicibacter terrae]ORW93561.1 short-chain dehydrogenase [Mycolicibacter terrae]BBX24331.1 short-chain dehydrogenase/reductase [Mycolicibacter terrae]SNV54291.1 short-chain dehydrogenase [Mycolicibacter terrae]